MKTIEDELEEMMTEALSGIISDERMQLALMESDDIEKETFLSGFRAGFASGINTALLDTQNVIERLSDKR